MQEVKQSKLRIWYNRELLNSSPENSFDIDFWREQGCIVGSAQGRGTTWFIQLKEIQAALRHYRRGGLFGKLIQDHYLFLGWEKTRAYEEFQLLQKLDLAGVNVPRPIAARVIKRNFCYQADLLSEKISNALDLVTILAQQKISDELYQAIGYEIRKMHDAQVNHTDLNIHNILVDDKNKVWLIDFDKCSLQSNHSWKSSNLDRLQRSFSKEKTKRNILWQESDFAQVIKGYQSLSA